MRVLHAAVLMAFMAGPVYAQNAVPRYGDADKAKSPQEIEGEREAERAYKRSLRNIPDQGPTDPWGNVRSESAPKGDAKGDPKAAAKAAPAKRVKAGTAN